MVACAGLEESQESHSKTDMVLDRGKVREQDLARSQRLGLSRKSWVEAGMT